MKLIKGLFTFIGAVVVIGFIFAFVKFDLGTRIGQVSKLDPQALPEYMKMFDKVLTTGDPAKGMIRKVKMVIPEGMTKQEALEYGKSLGLNPTTYGEEIILCQTIEAIKTVQLCDSCKFDYCGCSIQDSILQVDPEATFETFGCNSFEFKE